MRGEKDRLLQSADGSEVRCALHGVLLQSERGGPDMPTVQGRPYCPKCQEAFAASESVSGVSDLGGHTSQQAYNRSKRQSIEPTYDSRETGPAYHVTTRLGDLTTEFQRPIPDPFVRHTVTISWRGVLRSALRLRRPTVTVLIGGDKDRVDDVLELDANTLTPNSTRRDDFNESMGAAIRTFGASL